MARQLDKVLQDIYKSVTFEDQLTFQVAFQLYFVSQLNARIIF